MCAISSLGRPYVGRSRLSKSQCCVMVKSNLVIGLEQRGLRGDILPCFCGLLKSFCCLRSVENSDFRCTERFSLSPKYQKQFSFVGRTFPGPL